MGSIREHTIIKVLDQGRFGPVSLIRIASFKKEFVLKEIDLRGATVQEQRSAKLEAKLLETLHHENIVSYVESFQGSNGCLHIIMEYCRGGDLYQAIHLRNGVHFPEERVAEWLSQICQALKYLHDRNILHRDLKTKNIFLSETGDIKVGDLGIARVLKNKKDLARSMVGTPCYMSPEIFSQKPYNHKCDIWSLGCCMLEIVTLRQVFIAPNYEALKTVVLEGNLPPVPVLYSSDFVELILSFLCNDPKNRPSVGEILLSCYLRRHNRTMAKIKNYDKPEKHCEKKLKNRESHAKKLKNTGFSNNPAPYPVQGKLPQCSASEHINGRKSETCCMECKTSSNSSISLNSVITIPDINGNGDGNDNSQRTYTLRAQDASPTKSNFKIPCIYVSCKTPNSQPSVKACFRGDSKENINPVNGQDIFLSNHPNVAQSANYCRKDPPKLLPKKPSTSMSVYRVPKKSGESSLVFLNHLHQAIQRAREVGGCSSNPNIGGTMSTKLCLHSPSLPNLRDSCLLCEPDQGISWRTRVEMNRPCTCDDFVSHPGMMTSKDGLANKESSSVPALPVLGDYNSVLPKVHEILFPKSCQNHASYTDVNIDKCLIKHIITNNKNGLTNIAARQRRREKMSQSYSSTITKSAPASIERFPPISN